MKQLKISELIKELEKAKEEYGDEEIWYYLPKFQGGEGYNMPLEVEGIKVLKMSDTAFSQDFITIW